MGDCGIVGECVIFSTTRLSVYLSSLICKLLEIMHPQDSHVKMNLSNHWTHISCKL